MAFICIGILLLILLGLSIRNDLVFKVRMRQIGCIAENNSRHIHNGDYDLLDNYDEYDKLSYVRMILDLRKWTYNQFYGNYGKTSSC